MRGPRKPLAATQLVDFLAGNPGQPALLTILDASPAMSVRDSDALATPPAGAGTSVVASCVSISRHLTLLSLAPVSKGGTFSHGDPGSRIRCCREGSRESRWGKMHILCDHREIQGTERNSPAKACHVWLQERYWWASPI
jgi:hypothetical protein